MTGDVAYASARVLLAAGTGTYRHGAGFAEPLDNLREVPLELRSIVETLTELGYSPHRCGKDDYLLDPNVKKLRKAIRAAAVAAPIVVVYYTGHGLKPDASPFYLLTAGSEQDRLEDTALEPRQLLTLAQRRVDGAAAGEQPHVLVILDCCFSGAGGGETLTDALADVGNPNVWMLASAGGREWAAQGRFAAEFRAVLQAPPAGCSQPFVPLDSIAGAVNDALMGMEADQRVRVIAPRGESLGVPPFFPNPLYTPGVAGLTVQEQEWMRRLRAAPSEGRPSQSTSPQGTPSGLYVTGHTGRVRVLTDLAEWMRDPKRPGPAAVTGSPGSGKSTMLALPVLLREGSSRDALLAGVAPDSLLSRAASLFDGLSVLGVYARGMDPYKVTDEVAAALGRTADSPSELLKELEDQPDTTPRIVVVDAVDEARDPRRLLSDLLLPLAHRPGLRVVIGTRRHLLPPSTTTSLVVDLDADRYLDPQALVDYAEQLLLASHEPQVRTPYQGHDDLASTVAGAIAAKATASPGPGGRAESFLLAQLLAHAVRSRAECLDVTRARWADELPADVGGAFDEDLRRLGKREPAARALLTALAWAKGPGLPWERMWVPVARALHADAGLVTSGLDDDAVRWLLDSAGAYVVEDVGPGHRSAFRLFHDLLATHLRDEPGPELLAAPTFATAWRARVQHTEAVITRTLLDSVPTAPRGGPDWEHAHPYLRTYLAQHAYAAGPEAFADLVEDRDYLAVADPGTLTPLLTPTNAALRWQARTYRRALPLLGRNVHDNAAYLQEAEVAQTGRRPAGGRIAPTYRTLMACVHRDDSLLALKAPTWVLSVAFGTGADGRPLLASGDRDGTVQLWDPATGSPVGDPLTDHTDMGAQVTSLAFGTDAYGRQLLASGQDCGEVQLWDPVTGAAVGDPLAESGPVAFGMCAHRRLLLATAGPKSTVRLWDSDTGCAIGDPLAGHTGRVEALAFDTSPGGPPLLASGGDDGTVRLWDPDTGAAVGDPLTGHIGSVRAVAFGTDPDGRPLLASGGADGTIRLWDPVTGTPVGDPLIGHDHWVRSVDFGKGLNGRSLLASVGTDRVVRLWEPGTRALVGEPLTGHTDTTESVAFGTGADGRPLLASGSFDGTVRLWEAAPDPSGPPPVPRVSSPVRAVALATDAHGQPLLAAGSLDGTVRLWDPATGALVCEPMAQHTDAVESVALGMTADRRPLLASGSFDGTVRLWDASTGAPVGAPLTGNGLPVRSVAFGMTADRRLLLGSAGDGGLVWLWDPATGAPVGEPVGEPSDYQMAGAVAFGTGADGRLLLAAALEEGPVRLWDAASGDPVGAPLTGHTRSVQALAFGTGADGRLLLASSAWDGTVRLWDPVTGTTVATLPGQAEAVMSVAFSGMVRGKSLLLCGDIDGTVRLWDPASGTNLLVLQRRASVRSVATLGTLVAIGDQEGAAVLEIANEPAENGRPWAPRAGTRTRATKASKAAIS